MQPTTDNRQPATDVLILGGGPGGISALLWAHSAGLNALLLETANELGGQMLQMFHPVIDYPGLLPADGRALRDAFKQHADTLQLRSRTACHIESADLAAKRILCNGEWLSARALILATGARQRRLGLPGEEHAHHVDPNAERTYDHQPVCVIGGGDSAVENALILARTAAHVTIIHRSDRLRARAEWLAQAQATANITILTDTVPLAIYADSLAVQNTRDGARQTLPAAGVFIRVGIVPNTELFTGQIELDEAGYARVNQRQQTSLPLVYAIGDVCKPICMSVATAAGHAAVAVKDIQGNLTSAS
jgi:thioredoxin reductase (NADPH)